RPYAKVDSRFGITKTAVRNRLKMRFIVWPEGETPIHVCLSIFSADGKLLRSLASEGKRESLLVPALKPGAYRFVGVDPGDQYFPLLAYVNVSRWHGERSVCVQMIPRATTDTVSSRMEKCQ